MSRPQVAVLGGAVAGLAAAERFRSFADVTLFERQSFDEKRVNCGEAINEAALVPLEKTPDNGFCNRVERFDLEIYGSTDRDPDATPLATPRIGVECGYITDRHVVEREWAERLREGGVDVRDGENISVGRHHEIVEEYDYVVDATGQPSLSTKATDRTHQYTGDMVALNADVEGDFSDFRRTPRIVFEGYVGYWWAFPKSDTRANVGIGWAGDQRPDDYMAALRQACDRAGVPRPDRDDVNIYTIPRGPSLDPDQAHPEEGVFMVGDAAGIANRYQGEGICQAIRSSYLLADLVRAGREHEYPERLYDQMKAEYRLASLLRGVWEETEDPDLLAAVAEAIDGLTVEDVTRNPRLVYARILRHPDVLTQLLREPGIRKRLWHAYTDRWEFNHPRATPV